MKDSNYALPTTSMINAYQNRSVTLIELLLVRRSRILPKRKRRCRLGSLCVAAALFASAGIGYGYVLDNFAGGKAGWTDTLNGGSAMVASGVYTITTATGNGALTASIKTAAPTTPSLGTLFTPVAGHTLELRVDANSGFSAGVDTNAMAILAWVPSGSAVLANGYSLIVGANDLRVQKGGATLFSTSGLNLSNTNLALVLRITPSGSTVLLNVRVYQQVSAGTITAPSLLYEQTVTDSSPSLIGVAGNAGLAVQNRANPAGSSIIYGNLQAFDVISSVLDDFNSGTLNGWTTFTKHPSTDSVTNLGNQVEFIAGPDAAGGFAGMFYSGQSFVIVDGARLEFSIDCVNNLGGPHSYTVLGFVPGTGSTAITYLTSLIEYHIAEDAVNVYNGKAYNGWWADDVGAWPTENFRLTIIMTGEGTNVRLESRAEDLSKDVNDPSRLFFQRVIVDTPAKDQFEGKAPASSVTFPYMNPPIAAGSFAIDTFLDDIGPANIILDNARVNQTQPPNLPPVLNNVAPVPGANFLASSNHVALDLSDEVNVVLDSIVVTLNGVAYTNGSPGVTITPATATAASRHVDIDGALVDNVAYTGDILAKDPQGLATTGTLSFDTFLTNTYVVESENYNFSADGTTGGLFIDDPVLVAEDTTGNPNAYPDKAGLADVDFHDNRTLAWGSGAYDPLNDHSWRITDPVYTDRSADPARASIINAGGAGAMYFEQEVQDIRDGDWMNYTHHYPAGVYNVYLRQAQYALPLSLVTLDLVTSDPTVAGQTTTTLGAFLQTPSGTGQFRDVPLTDGVGNPIVLKFDGSVKTLRISQRQTGNASSSAGILEQNYFALVPAVDPGTLRPIVSSAQPLPNSTVVTDPGGAITPTSITIANRDTSVNTNTIVLTLNGNPVSTTNTVLSGGIKVDWPFASTPAAPVVTASVSFQDSDGTNLTYSWSFSYPFLSASNRWSSSALTERGWTYRMVQAASVNGAGNSLATAEQQLSQPPEIPYDVTWSTNGLQLLTWNDDTGVPNGVPGLDSTGNENIACEMLGYMHLTAGAHRFYVSSDDGFQLRSGTKPSDPFATVIGFRDGGTIDGAFDFLVEADGLYPVRCIWYEHTGGAHFSLSSVNLNDNSHTLINDTGGVEVYVANYELDLFSSASAGSGSALDPAGVLDRTAQTLTVPMSGSTHFYKISGPSAVKITGIVKVGSNIVISYQFQ